ncbi:MAG: hypothetical protein ACREBD_40185, partial [Blastocatellia bacterium]
MLRKLFYSLTALIVLSLVALAQGNKPVSLTGHIVDKMCSAGEAKKDAPGAAMGKGCALSERCAKSGFGVFADGKWIEFDEKGSALAKTALEKTSKDKGAKFKVTGKVADG